MEKFLQILIKVHQHLWLHLSFGDIALTIIASSTFGEFSSYPFLNDSATDTVADYDGDSQPYGLLYLYSGHSNMWALIYLI